MNLRTVMTILVLGCLAAGAVLWLGPVMRENRVTREAIGRLQSSIERQAQEIAQLNRELRELRTDYRAIERVAREQFGLCRPGEEIYHFEEPAGRAAKGSKPSPGEANPGDAAKMPGP
jgi:cell division protein FtsB